jgi:hypothetical protein
MKLFILAVIIIFVISLSIITNKEGLSNYKENKFLKEQDAYYDNRRFPSIIKGDKNSTRFFDLKKKKKLVVKGNSKYIKKNEIDKNEENCNIINGTENCDNISATNCGYCYSENKFMYGNNDGPLTNVCRSGWIKPGLDSGYFCKKMKEQKICEKVKSCGDSIGEASICGWCPATQKGYVKKNNGKGGWTTKYKDDKCNWKGSINNVETSLIDVKDCSKFRQMFPCMGPNWDTGPHNEKCLSKLWGKSGCTGNFREQIPKSGLNLSDELNKWNTNSFASVAANMKSYFKKTNSKVYEESNKYNLACFNKKIDPCQVNFNMRPTQCDYKLWKESGCLDKGSLNPIQPNISNKWDNLKWRYNKKHHSDGYSGHPSQNQNGNTIVKSIKDKFNRLKSELSQHKLFHSKNPKKHSVYRNLEKSCKGTTPDLPYSKQCWKDFTFKMIHIGVRLPSAMWLKFSNSDSDFKNILKKTNSNQESNVRPLWYNDYILKKTTYELPDFPFWEFDVVFNKIKNNNWDNFKRKMLLSPHVKLKIFRNKYGWTSESLVIDKNSRFANILPVTTTDNTSEYTTNKQASPMYYQKNNKLYATKWLYESFHFPYSTFIAFVK